MMEVIDFHSHVLPGIDDGSKNIETSMEMLQTSKASGVDRMIATPHFYADCDRIERFLERRKQAYLSIADKLSDDTPKLLLGAEVAFFEGISQAEKIEALTICDSNLMLLEMPFRTWRQSDIEEVKQLIYKKKFFTYHCASGALYEKNRKQEIHFRINGASCYDSDKCRKSVGLETEPDAASDGKKKDRYMC